MSILSAHEIDQALRPLTLNQRLQAARRLLPGRLVFTTSFGLEDQVVTHAISEADVAIEIVTLDTGRLFAETYEVWSDTEARYRRRIDAFTPNTAALEALVEADGINGLRQSREARQRCCGVRKVVPLGRALSGAAGWVTGLRGGQSQSRAATPLAEFDAERNLIKLNPIADWSREDVAGFIALNEIPYNVLHDRGFPSIGCAPCTRAVRIGEDERAGRWWWENDGKKECGLHNRVHATTI